MIIFCLSNSNRYLIGSLLFIPPIIPFNPIQSNPRRVRDRDGYKVCNCETDTEIDRFNPQLTCCHPYQSMPQTHHVYQLIQRALCMICIVLRRMDWMGQVNLYSPVTHPTGTEHDLSRIEWIGQVNLILQSTKNELTYSGEQGINFYSQVFQKSV